MQNIQKDWFLYLPEDADINLNIAPLNVSEAQWRKRLTDAEFRVLREKAIEWPSSGDLNEEEQMGVYVCAACELPLFTSAMKFDSGTGWPSFFSHIPGHLGTQEDHSLLLPRTEYHCVRCEGHQGYVFEDGPAPTGERWHNNSVSLHFWPTDSKQRVARA
ncbi:peptide-methionine (R)-S-oxide reductase MsrB [Aliidiomarina quisquiliarum]|uniref:peptide-methionine (R)-S-oxide reductase MsrB n=1 Tax=Aliidiomarina quisquiliarum TaxID=2938947 RepID=UPI00208FAB39|nr:peptide-methionine (R)-S-oxide reductase MsrB [Aliidiomarina quisquiliarum]MCO4321593.1 peptide-methionine (R)-S-oxide reductase MsrB [Aliidiomarina quisquiliarum]